MTRFVLLGASLIALAVSNAAMADGSAGTWQATAAYTWAYPAPYPNDWDRRIGYDFWTRLVNYYALEWGHDGAPPDPTAPPGRLAGGTGEHAALSLHGMAVWRRDEHRGDQAELGGQPADGGACQHRVRQSAERRARPDLRLDQRRRQRQHQHGEAGRQLAGSLYVHAQHGAARSGSYLRRAVARHGADGPHRLGLPRFRVVRRELPLHDRLWPSELPTAEPQPRQRIRFADGVWRSLRPVGIGWPVATVRPFHLASRHRGAACAKQFNVLALDGL